MTLTDDLRVRSYAALLRERALAADEPEPPDDRSQKVDAFAAFLLLLWRQLRAGDISQDQFLAKVQAEFQRVLGTVPADAQAEIAKLEEQAISRARQFAQAAVVDEDSEAAPSDVQAANWSHMVAGALWAATFAAMVLERPAKPERPHEPSDDGEAEQAELYEWEAQDDPSVCPDCAALNGQQFPRDEIPFWPGAGDFGENTQCGPNCRCRLREV